MGTLIGNEFGQLDGSSLQLIYSLAHKVVERVCLLVELDYDALGM